MNAPIQIKNFLLAWETLRSATDIAPIRTTVHYRRMVALFDGAGSNEKHPAMGMVDIVGDLLKDFEAAHYSLLGVIGIQAQTIQVNNKDLLYESNAPIAEPQKFLNVVFSATYPLLTVAQSLK